MPVTKSASKKMRADQRKTVVNLRQKRGLKTILKQAQETRTAESIREAISKIDKAVKNHLIHANKASRLKSQLMKEASAAPTQKAATKKKSSAKKAGSKKTAKSKK